MRREASRKSLRPGKSHSVHFKAVPVEQVHSSHAQHAGQLVLVAALMIVIAKHGNDGNMHMLQHREHGAHLLRQSVIGKVSGNHKGIGQLVDHRKCRDVLLVILRLQMNIGDGCNPHSSLPTGFSTRSRQGWRSQYSR